MHDGLETRGTSALTLVRYREPERAVAWLVRALGFTLRRVVTRADGSFGFAHMAFGDSLVMVTPVRDAPFDRLFKMPDETGRTSTQACYFQVPDIEAHHARAKAAGADIVLDIKLYEHGGCRYACRDTEGHLWTFGTYDPRDGAALPAPDGERHQVVDAAPVADMALPQKGLLPLSRLQGALLVGALGFGALAVWLALDRGNGGTRASSPEPVASAGALLVEARRELAAERASRQIAEESLKSRNGEVTTERQQRQAAEEEATRLSREVAELRAAATAAAAPAGPSWPAAVASGPKTTGVAGAENPADDPGRAPTPVADASPAPAAAPEAVPAPDPVETPVPAPGAPAVAPAKPSRGAAADAVLAARRKLEHQASMGSAEAALALGSTYDPINSALPGAAAAGFDRERAKAWYRRALALAQARTAKSEAP